MMKTVIKPIDRLLGSLLFGLISSAALAAPGHAPPTPVALVAPPATEGPRHWQLREKPSDDMVEIVQASAQGKFSFLCERTGCSAFIEPSLSCQPGSAYPLFANSARSVGVVHTLCVSIRDDAPPRTGLVLLDDSPTMADLFHGEKVSLAFPSIAGQMSIITVDPDGLRQSLQDASRMFERPGDANTNPGQGSAQEPPTPDQRLEKVLDRTVTDHYL